MKPIAESVQILSFSWPLLMQLASLAAVVVAVAYVVGRVAPDRRRRVKRLVVPFGIYVTAVFAQLALSYAMPYAPVIRPSWIDFSGDVAWLCVRLLAVNAGALLFFELAIPRLRLQIPNIVHELVLGAAYVITLFIFLRRNGVDFSSLVATSAVVTAILAFSMQATLGNMFGGLTLQLDDSISVGDWIRFGSDVEGLVKEIRWRHVVIETRNWDTVIVPNSSLLSQTITVLGKRQGQPVQHRMWVHFNVDFRFSPATVIETIEKSLRSAPLPGVAATPKPDCICFDLANNGRDSFAHYAVRYWLTDLAKDDPTSSIVRVRVFAALKRAGIPLAVPAATIFVAQDDEAHAERKAMREHQRRSDVLSKVELFTNITADERDQLASRLSYAMFARGEVITRQGAEAHWLYILCSGSVDIRAARDGTESVVGTISAPGFFGEHGLMTGTPRSATVTATSEVECYRLDREAVNQLVHARPEVATELATILAHRQQGLDKALSNEDGRVKTAMADDQSRQILRKMQQFFGLGAEK